MKWLRCPFTVKVDFEQSLYMSFQLLYLIICKLTNDHSEMVHNSYSAKCGFVDSLLPVLPVSPWIYQISVSLVFHIKTSKKCAKQIILI